MPSHTNGATERLRPLFFDRQPLAAADLNLGMTYVRERLARHNRFLHGWGVVAGAEARQPDPATPWRVEISAGYGVTPHGHEVYLPAAVTFDMEAGVLACLGTSDDCPPAHLVAARIDPPGRDQRTDYNQEWVELGLSDSMSLAGFTLQHTVNIDEPGERLATYYTFSEPTVWEAGTLIRIHSGRASDHTAPPPDRVSRYRSEPDERGNWRLNNRRDRLRLLDPSGALVDEQIFVADTHLPTGAGMVFLALCPQDEPCAPQAALPERCQPPGGHYEWSRVVEGVRVRVLCALPPSHAAALLSCEEVDAIVCGGALPPAPLALTEADDCVVLAAVAVRGTTVTIDNRAGRRVLLSESLVQAAVRCGCEAPPAPTVPPTERPTAPPTTRPTFQPTVFPTFRPTFIVPTAFPTFIQPTVFPTFRPTFIQPTFFPTFQPTFIGPGPIIGPGGLGPVIGPGGLGPIIGPGGPGPIIGGGGIPLDFGALEAERGRLQSVRAIRGIGERGGERLAAVGVTTVLDFAARPASEVARALGISEVRVAALQLEARQLMGRPSDG